MMLPLKTAYMCWTWSSAARLIGVCVCEREWVCVCVCHQSTARAIREQTSPNTLSPYDHHTLLSRVTWQYNRSLCGWEITFFHIAILSPMQLIVQPYLTLLSSVELLVGLSRYHKMSYDTIPAEVSRYQVVSRYHPCSVVSLKLNSTKWINK